MMIIRIAAIALALAVSTAPALALPPLASGECWQIGNPMIDDVLVGTPDNTIHCELGYVGSSPDDLVAVSTGTAGEVSRPAGALMPTGHIFERGFFRRWLEGL